MLGIRRERVWVWSGLEIAPRDRIANGAGTLPIDAKMLPHYQTGNHGNNTGNRGYPRCDIFSAEHLIIRLMRRFTQQRRKRNHLRYIAMGKKSQAVQAVQAARRSADLTPADLQDLAANPQLRAGSVLGRLEWHNYVSGRVTRWAVLRGTRINNYVLRAPDGRVTRAHGWAWLLGKLRHVLLIR